MIIIAYPTTAIKGGTKMKTLDKLHVIAGAQARNEARDRAYARRNADTEAEIRIWCHGGRKNLEIFYTADLVLVFPELNATGNVTSISIGWHRNYYDAVEVALRRVERSVADTDAILGTRTAIYASDDTGYREWVGGAMPMCPELNDSYEGGAYGSGRKS
jgi:hypothetical protein